jgi:hypothetical protein
MPLLLLAALFGLVKLLRLHLGIANDCGSPHAQAPFAVSDPTLAQAIYGRLGPERPAEYYSFNAIGGMGVRAMLLIPERSYDDGLRAQFAILGPGLPEAGATSIMRPQLLTIAGRDFILAQAYVPPLPESGVYQLVVRRLDGEGAYCLCLGEREAGHADQAMRARISRLLEA